MRDMTYRYPEWTTFVCNAYIYYLRKEIKKMNRNIQSEIPFSKVIFPSSFVYFRRENAPPYQKKTNNWSQRMFLVGTTRRWNRVVMQMTPEEISFRKWITIFLHREIMYIFNSEYPLEKRYDLFKLDQFKLLAR